MGPGICSIEVVFLFRDLEAFCPSLEPEGCDGQWTVSGLLSGSSVGRLG